MVGWHHGLNGPKYEQTPGDSEGQGSLACCVHEVSGSGTTEWLNNSIHIHIDSKNNPRSPLFLYPYFLQCDFVRFPINRWSSFLSIECGLKFWWALGSSMSLYQFWVKASWGLVHFCCFSTAIDKPGLVCSMMRDKVEWRWTIPAEATVNQLASSQPESWL